MMSKFILNCCMFYIFITCSFTYGFKYNICSLEKHRQVCSQLERGKNIKCIQLVDEASCLAKIESGHLDFASVSAEAAFLAAPFSKNVRVLASILESGADYKYETVVLTNKPVKSFEELRGFSYCHPGLNTTDISRYLLQELESKILEETEEKSKDCDNSLTVIENYIKKLNEFFGSSCRHGRWVQDEKLDAKLKNIYKNLTARCNEEISVVDEKNYLKRSFECLRNAPDATIAITTANTVTDVTGLYYLCKNGSTTETPCIWAQQPYRLIVTKNSTELNDELPAEFRAWFPANYKPTVPDNQNSVTPELSLQQLEIDQLAQILEINNVDYFINISNSLTNYTAALRDAPNRDKAKLCKRSMKWCTISEDEQRKCDWLSQASLNYGIQPLVECQQRSRKRECIQTISDGEADLVMIGADFGFTAKKKGLSAIAFPETYDTQEIRTVLLVNTSSGISRLENLKGKRGCFSRYGDIAWISFIDVMRGVIADQGSCDYGKIIADVVGPSCMPMIKDNQRVIPDTVDKEKVCKLCIARENNTCDADDTNVFYRNDGAIRCLEHEGDFAVFSKPDEFSVPVGTSILCKNGTLAPEGQSDVDDNCYLSVLTTSEVLTRRGDAKNADIQSALLEFDHWFAVRRDSPFRLFDSFHEQADLLFKDSTPGLDLPSSAKPAIKSYVEVFKKVDECASANMTATSPQPGIPTTAKPGSNASETAKIGTFWIFLALYFGYWFW